MFFIFTIIFIHIHLSKVIYDKAVVNTNRVQTTYFEINYPVMLIKKNYIEIIAYV